MDLSRFRNLSIFFIFFFCFFSHFIYDLFPSFFTSVFFPVNESIWEHMKMLVSSVVIWEVILFFIFKSNGFVFDNFWVHVLIICVCSVLIFLIIYLPFFIVFGDNFIINIVFLFISIFLSVKIGFNVLERKKYNLEFISVILIIMIYILFGFLTYYPLKNFLFLDPSSGEYGINFH